MMQNIIHFPRPCPIAARGGVVLIGNFDGVHLGHQALIATGFQTGLQVTALTFEPHPKSFFSTAPLFRLTTIEEKAIYLHKAGVSHLALCDFNADFVKLTPQEFIDKVLINWLGAKHVITGVGFRFGHGRAGDDALLSNQFFTYTAVPPVLFEGEPISSSRIRKALAAGDLPLAKTLLGRDYALEGVVIHGRKQGRELGYPTANIALNPSNGLKLGVYAVYAKVEGVTYKGVASFGTRPMFDNGAPLLEVHLFDFKGDLYDKTMQVSFISYLRSEMKFENLPTLILQMNEDSQKSRAILLD